MPSRVSGEASTELGCDPTSGSGSRRRFAFAAGAASGLNRPRLIVGLAADTIWR